MRTDIREDQDWKTLLSFLPEGLTELAFSTGAIQRAREVRTGEDLLRLNLVYGDDEMSLRQVSAWSRSNGIADISDVALLKRLRLSGPFLKQIASSLLGQVSVPGSALRAVVLDATTLSRQRSRGSDFRVHVSYELSTGRVSGVELTDASEGERLTRAVAGEGDLVIVDRGYQGRAPLAEVRQSGAHILLRFHPGSLPLEAPEGLRLSPLRAARSLSIGQTLDIPVRTVPTKNAPAVQGRLVVLKKTESQAQKDLKRLKQRAKEDGRDIGEDALQASRFVFLFSTLAQEQADARQILEIYRLRWQIEMLFKKVKGIVSLGETAAKDFALCEAMILSQLIVLLLIQAYESAFFPWGYPLRRPQPLALVSG